MHDWKKEVKKYIILIPLYNDWKSVSKLLAEIDTIVNNWNAEVSVIIVNDASTEEKSGLNVTVNNKKNNTGTISFEYQNLDQLDKLIETIKNNY